MTTLAQLPNVSGSSFDDRRHLLDELILSSSECLAKCSVAAIDCTIVSTLEGLCRAAGVDHTGWLLLDEETGVMERLTSAPTVLLVDRIIGVNLNNLQWCKSCLIKGQPVLLKNLAELPRDAEADRTYLESFGVQSLSLIPIDAGECSRGILAILSLRNSCSWSSAFVRQCMLLGTIFLGAHARKTIHQEKENSDANFREIFRSASVGMTLEDTAGRLLYVNEALCNMIGYTEAELLTMRCSDFSHRADLAREAVLFNRLFRKERRAYEMEKRFLHRSGKIVWGKVNVTILQESSREPSLVLSIVEDLTAQKTTIQQLTTSQIEVQSLASRLIASQEQERQRIARELHDDIGQRLSMVTSEMHLLKDAVKDDSHQSRIGKLCEELDVLVTDLHCLSHQLHSSKLQHLGVKPALRDLCAQLARSGLHVDLTLGEQLEPLGEEVGLCLYRIAQEALNNVLKHSGGAQAALTLSKTANEYQMIVKDTGTGFDTKKLSSGLGLISMKERLGLLNGRITVNSIVGQGTEIMIRIPLNNACYPAAPPHNKRLKGFHLTTTPVFLRGHSAFLGTA